MSDKAGSITHALVDASVNAVAIFTLTLGGLILTSNSISTVSLKPALVTSTAVAMIRFALRLYQEDGINLEGMGELAPIPIGKKETNVWSPKELYNLCKIF